MCPIVVAIAKDYVGNVRDFLTYAAQCGGLARFLASPSDLDIRKECARLCTIGSSRSCADIIATALISHASAFPTRDAVWDLNRKQINPDTAPKSPGAPRGADRQRTPRRDAPGDRLGKKRSDGRPRYYDRNYSSSSAGNFAMRDENDTPRKFPHQGKCRRVGTATMRTTRVLALITGTNPTLLV